MKLFEGEFSFTTIKNYENPIATLILFPHQLLLIWRETSLIRQKLLSTKSTKQI